MKNWKTFYEIFVEDGALGLEEKLVVSIMVCSLLGCHYFYDLFLLKFLFWDGDKNWIFKSKQSLAPRLLKLRGLIVTL